MQGVNKKDPIEVESRLGRQLIAYRNDYEDVDFLLSVDPAKFNPEEQDMLARFVMRAIVAYQGFNRNEQKIAEITGMVSFGIPNKISRMFKGIETKVREAFAYSMALVLGFNEYETKTTHYEADPTERKKYGPAYYVGDPTEKL